MDIKEKVVRTIKEHDLLKKGDKIVLGFSGGPDSTALLFAISEYARANSWTVFPVHINHMLRPGEAERDMKFSIDTAQKLCEDTDGSVKLCRCFTFDCGKLAAEQGMTTEEMGRKLRYEAYRTVAKEIGADAIALAHNAGDQAETILFRILRGTGTDGLSGMAYKRNDEGGIPIVRPLMDCTREEIEAYLEKNKIEFVTDSTNLEPVYQRNRIRLELLPYLAKEFNPNITETLNRLGAIAAEDRDFIRDYAAEACEACVIEREEGKHVVLSRKVLEKLHNAVRFRVYNLCMKELGLESDVSRTHLLEIEKVRLSNNPRAWTPVVANYRVERDHDKLTFIK